MSDRFGKSIFAHKQTYSRKGPGQNELGIDVAYRSKPAQYLCRHLGHFLRLVGDVGSLRSC